MNCFNFSMHPHLSNQWSWTEKWKTTAICQEIRPTNIRDLLCARSFLISAENHEKQQHQKQSMHRIQGSFCSICQIANETQMDCKDQFLKANAILGKENNSFRGIVCACKCLLWPFSKFNHQELWELAGVSTPCDCSFHFIKTWAKKPHASADDDSRGWQGWGPNIHSQAGGE